jgi:ribose 5-phosphate isomerase A
MPQAKLNAAKAAINYLLENYHEPQNIGIGTGSTTNLFIQELAKYPHLVKTTVSSSEASTKLLHQYSIPVTPLNDISDLQIYIDGADSFNKFRQLIKGHGGALFREKIISHQAKKFICLVDDSKKETILGTSYVPLEVLPMARSFVARAILKLHGQPRYRDGFKTDNGNIILDIFDWKIEQPIKMEETLNNIPGIVCNGIFAVRPADLIIIGNEKSATAY